MSIRRSDHTMDQPPVPSVIVICRDDDDCSEEEDAFEEPSVGGDYDLEDESFLCEFQEAFKKESIAVMRTLLSRVDASSRHRYMNYTKPTGDQASLLHEAVKSNRYETAEFLLDQGALVDIRDYAGETPLHWACSAKIPTEQAKDWIHLLVVEYDADLEARNKDGWTPFLKACFREKHALIPYLYELGARVRTVSYQQETALHLACRGTQLDMFDFTIQKNALPTVQALLNTLLKANSKRKSKETSHDTLVRSAHALDARGNTPLHCVRRNSRIAQLLIDRCDASVNIANHDGNQPLHMCVDHLATMQVLLDAGADVNASNHQGNTPLHFVFLPDPELAKDQWFHTRSCDEQVLSELLSRGADTRKTNHQGETPLHLSIPRYSLRGIQMILDHAGSSSNLLAATKDTGRTVLHIACEWARWDVVQALMRKVGQECVEFLSIKDSSGETALDVICNQSRLQGKWSKTDQECIVEFLAHGVNSIHIRADAPFDLDNTSFSEESSEDACLSH